MHLFKITLAASYMATFTLAIDITTGTVETIDYTSFTGTIRPDDGSAYIPMEVLSVVCQSAPSIYPRLERRHLLKRWQTDRWLYIP
jgi:hypothetical protein